MTPKERVFARLEGKPVDRAPNLNIIMQYAAKQIKIPYGRYCTDYKLLVEGNLYCCEKFAIDMVSAISDPFREASGFGAKVNILYDDVPSCNEYLIKEYTDISKIQPVDPVDSERMMDRVKAIDLYKEKVSAYYPILGWVEGPFAEACDLRGINNMMMDIYDAQNFATELMEICLTQAVAFAREQIEAGADFIGVGDAAASLVGPRIYQELVLPFEKRLFSEIHKLGAKVKLHICGNITPLLELLPQTGADMIDVDWMVDLKQAVTRFSAASISTCGNFDPVEVLLRGDVATVKEAVEKCLDAGDQSTFIAAGCEVPKETPDENMLAVANAIREYNCKK